jgi:membrane protease subunit HflK
MEEVYSNTSKVLIDSESSGNLLYLPIDKLAGQDSDSSKARKSRTGSAYDEIQLESDRKDVAPKSNSETRSTSRQGRY